MKALISNVVDDELLMVKQLVKKHNGHYLGRTPNQHKVVAVFDSEDDIVGFDIEVCDLGYDVRWKK
jgi:hypothetical protein